MKLKIIIFEIAPHIWKKLRKRRRQSRRNEENYNYNSNNIYKFFYQIRLRYVVACLSMLDITLCFSFFFFSLLCSSSNNGVEEKWSSFSNGEKEKASSQGIMFLQPPCVCEKNVSSEREDFHGSLNTFLFWLAWISRGWRREFTNIVIWTREMWRKDLIIRALKPSRLPNFDSSGVIVLYFWSWLNNSQWHIGESRTAARGELRHPAETAKNKFCAFVRR